MSDEPEPQGPPDDWPHRHPHLSTVLIALLGAVPLGGLFALGDVAGGIVAGAAIAAVVILLFEGLSLALRFPIAASLLSGTPREQYRYLGPDGTEAVFTHGDGGSDGGGGGGRRRRWGRLGRRAGQLEPDASARRAIHAPGLGQRVDDRQSAAG